MKKIFGVLSVSLLLCCLTMAITSASLNTFYGEVALERQSISTQKSTLYQTCADSFFQSSSSFYVQWQIQRVPLTSSKNPTSSFLLVLQTVENLFAFTFLQYQSTAQKFIVRFRKADLIFPFHYFW